MNVGSLMVAVSKLKSRLGSPPESSAAKDNLRQPEEVPHITDRRSLRATGRTAQLATRIKPETLKLRQLAAGQDYHGGSHSADA